jgi:hypothetical protein
MKQKMSTLEFIVTVFLYGLKAYLEKELSTASEVSDNRNSSSDNNPKQKSCPQSYSKMQENPSR